MVIAGALEGAADGAAGHATVAGHDNAVGGGDEGGAWGNDQGSTRSANRRRRWTAVSNAAASLRARASA